MTIKRPTTVRCSFAIAVVALLAAVVAIAAQPARAVTNCSPSASWGTNRADLASQVVGLINQHRAGIGLSPLAVSSPLTASSTWKSLHMAGQGYFDHSDPSPPVARSAYQRATDCGYGGSRWGENIAWGYTSAQSVVNGWLGSSGHKANIENPSFSSTGVGVAANAAGQLYWTQNFGNDVSGGTPPAPTPPPPAPPPTATPPASAPATSGATTPSAPSGAADPARSATSLLVGAKRAHVTRERKRSRLTASVAFVTMASGRPVTAGSVRCRAEVDGKRLRVLANVFKAEAARCTWRVPTWARGKQLTGVVAVQLGEIAATRLFMRTIE